MQITQDAVLYACRFTGTACVPRIIQGPHCHSGLQSVEATAQCSNVSTTTGTQAKRLLRFCPPPQKLPSIMNSHNTRENNLFFTLHQEQTHCKLVRGGCSGTSQHHRFLHGYRRCVWTTDGFQLYPVCNWTTFIISEDLSSSQVFLPHTCGSPLLGRGSPRRGVTAPAPGEMLAGLHPAPAGEEQAFPGAFEELEGAVVGFKVSAASLVRQSKRLQQLSAALSQICSRQRKPL